jgi:plastocyanin
MSRISPALVGVTLAAVLGACSSSNDSNPPPAGNTITVGANGSIQFSPLTLTIAPGGSVRFVWASNAINHNVVPASGNSTALPMSPGVGTPLLAPPQDFSIVFPAAGVFRFYCSAHGANPAANTVTGMSGTITVQ